MAQRVPLQWRLDFYHCFGARRALCVPGAHPAINRMKALLIVLFVLAMLFAAWANLCRERRL